jgi:hypothetical protein
VATPVAEALATVEEVTRDEVVAAVITTKDGDTRQDNPGSKAAATRSKEVSLTAQATNKRTYSPRLSRSW